jgi:Protein of unknown function DUF262/Protein of unknown function (DUF1524)
MKIDASDKNVEDLFTADFLTIPDFQRAYSWDDENLEEFWVDVSKSKEDYFIGSMVLYRSGRQECGVVDGQQRLTTITILLCVIRNFLNDLGKTDLANGIHALIERGDRNSINRFVVKTETSYPFFAEEIQKFGPRDFATDPQLEEQRLKAAFDFFQAKVSLALQEALKDQVLSDEKKLETKIGKLTQLRDLVLFLKLIRIELENKDDAIQIFETLNTRGKDLALADLLKTLFFKMIKKTGTVDTAKEQWKKLISTISNSDGVLELDLFFTHSWSSKYEATTQQKTFKVIKEAIDDNNAKKYLNDFVTDASHYVAIFNPEAHWTKEQKEITNSLKALRLFKVSQPTPGVLSLVRAHKSGILSDRALKRALRAIEEFHFLFTAVTSSRSSGGISAMYSSFGRKLFAAQEPNLAGQLITELIDKLVERRPSENEFLVAFEQLTYTKKNSKQSTLIRYILQKFAKYHALAFNDDLANLTIEHVYPQSQLNEQWSDGLIGSVGNLMLLTQEQNAQVKDDEFPAKKLVFQSFRSSVPADVLDKVEWSPEVVVARTKSMATMAYNGIWTLK